MNAWAPASARWLAAAFVLLAYAALCVVVWWRHRRPSGTAHGGGRREPPVLIAYASQTGTALLLAQQAEATFKMSGQSVRLLPLNQVSRDDLATAPRALFLVATHGDGGAPDNGAGFERRLMARPMTGNMSVHAGVLALGDSGYAGFCAFGRRLDQWLKDSSAQILFDRIEVDRSDETSLQQWRQAVAHLAGTGEVRAWPVPSFRPWRLNRRTLLNPGSSAAPICLLELVPTEEGAMPPWQAGDLVQLRMPQDPDRPREYSIASIPQDGHLALVVRQELREDGTVGLASGWLTQQAPLGSLLDLRLREQPLFRLGDNAGRPLILIGNGSGWAGLRSHLRAQAASQGRGHWLLFGERNARHDNYAGDDVRHWRDTGVLARADLVFSRDQSERPYVQHVPRRESAWLRQQVDAGAAIYVCGSLQGMAGGVDEALRAIAGDARIDALMDEGRYRRDVY